MHILMSGGGTLGPVTPLLAVAAELRKRDPNVHLSWIGTPNGPERLVVESSRIAFHALAAPKLDRYRRWTWPFMPFFMIVSCVRALRLLRALKPDAVLSAGGFVSVPVVWMAWLLRVPSWIHQLDILPLLANKLMAPFARRVSVTFEESAKAFPAKKTIAVGGMIRKQLRAGERDVALQRYGFDAALPTVLVIGGGTGAQAINDAMTVIRPDLLHHMNVLHLVGRGKLTAALEEAHPNYVALEFLNEGIADAYAAADVVVCRGGLGTIMELAALGKAAIVIPIAEPFQEANARMLEERNAADVLWYLTPQILAQALFRLIDTFDRREELAHNIRTLMPLNGDERIAHEILAMVCPQESNP